MNKLTNAAVMVVALGTAYGLGIISCVAWEVKLLAEAVTEVEKSKNKKPTYRRYVPKHKDSV